MNPGVENTLKLFGSILMTIKRINLAMHWAY